MRSNAFEPQDITHLSTVLEELQRCHRTQEVTNQNGIRQERFKIFCLSYSEYGQRKYRVTAVRVAI